MPRRTDPGLRQLAYTTAAASLALASERQELLSVLHTSALYIAADEATKQHLEHEFTRLIGRISNSLASQAAKIRRSQAPHTSSNPLWWRELAVIVVDHDVFGNGQTEERVYTVWPHKPGQYYHGVDGASYMTAKTSSMWVRKIYLARDFRDKFGDTDWDAIELQCSLDFPLEPAIFDPQTEYGGWVSPEGMYYVARYQEHEGVARHLLKQYYQVIGTSDDLLARGWLRIDFTGYIRGEAGSLAAQSQINTLCDMQMSMRESTSEFKRNFDRSVRNFMEA